MKIAGRINIKYKTPCNVNSYQGEVEVAKRRSLLAFQNGCWLEKPYISYQESATVIKILSKNLCNTFYCLSNNTSKSFLMKRKVGPT